MSIDIGEQIEKWTCKLSELQVEAVELDSLGQASGAAKCRKDARLVQDHIRRLESVINSRLQ